MSIDIDPMVIDDYDDVLALWRQTEGVGLSAADEPSAIAQFLARNPGLSQVAHEGPTLIGAVLCGHDSRRGYLHHLAVAPSHRRRGIGRTLVDRCLAALGEAGIDKCHLFVFSDSTEAIAFWRSLDWTDRVDLKVMSRRTRQTGRSALSVRVPEDRTAVSRSSQSASPTSTPISPKSPTTAAESQAPR